MTPTLKQLDQALARSRREVKPRSYGELLHYVSTERPDLWAPLSLDQKEYWCQLAGAFFRLVHEEAKRQVPST